MNCNPDNPMARPLSRAEEERLYGDDVADAQRADFAIERTLNVIKSGIDAAFDELEIGEYGRERDLIVQVLKLAAGRRDADVVASAVNELLAEIVKNRDADYWNAVDEQARRLRDVWHLSNSIASVACGLSIKEQGMNTRHTPGPWVAQKDGYSVLSEDWLIGTPGGKPDEVAVCSKRDAALIAAAPELLAALETAYMALIGYLPAHRNDVTDAAIGAARAAITKATGEAA